DGRLAASHVHVGEEGAADPLGQHERRREHDQADRDDDPAMVERPLQRAAVGAIDLAEEAFAVAADPPVGAQDPRAEHRRQRQADQQRHHDRERHREAERIDEPLAVAGHERHRQEDDDQRHRGRDPTDKQCPMSDTEVAHTASVTSFVPLIAAWNGGAPSSSMWRKMFSSTTIASSMTMPTANVRPSGVMLFSVRPGSRISPKLAMIVARIASEAISTTRKLRMNTMIT